MINKIINFIIKKLEKPNYIIDTVIVILVILVVILTDLFVVGLRSAPGEFFAEMWKGDSNEQNEQIEVNEPQLPKLEQNQIVFAPILNFHHIDFAPANVSEITASYYIEPEKFEKMIEELKNSGYQIVFLSEIINLMEDGYVPPDNFIALTFDDGNENFYTNAWPILQKHGAKSSVYIMTGVGGPNYLSKEQIFELSESGLVEIGSHTVWHPKLTKISADERLYELEKSRDDLHDLLNKEVDILAYPYGLYNQDIKDLAKAVGYKAGLTFDQEAWQNSGDLMELKRISVYPELNVIKFLDKLKRD